mmetsp:Transcript_460/g.842  ORF Transcript_460/g.842 Transcript_460/m.842 type:complete len:511 (+) Transcript_460:171-1703(+)
MLGQQLTVFVLQKLLLVAQRLFFLQQLLLQLVNALVELAQLAQMRLRPCSAFQLGVLQRVNAVLQLLLLLNQLLQSLLCAQLGAIMTVHRQSHIFLAQPRVTRVVDGMMRSRHTRLGLLHVRHDAIAQVLRLVVLVAVLEQTRIKIANVAAERIQVERLLVALFRLVKAIQQHQTIGVVREALGRVLLLVHDALVHCQCLGVRRLLFQRNPFQQRLHHHKLAMHPKRSRMFAQQQQLLLGQHQRRLALNHRVRGQWFKAKLEHRRNVLRHSTHARHQLAETEIGGHSHAKHWLLHILAALRIYVDLDRSRRTRFVLLRVIAAIRLGGRRVWCGCLLLLKLVVVNLDNVRRAGLDKVRAVCGAFKVASVVVAAIAVANRLPKLESVVDLFAPRGHTNISHHSDRFAVRHLQLHTIVDADTMNGVVRNHFLNTPKTQEQTALVLALEVADVAYGAIRFAFSFRQFNAIVNARAVLHLTHKSDGAHQTFWQANTVCHRYNERFLFLRGSSIHD